MFITSILQFLDKTALNYANLFGIREDLHLTGSEFNWLASIFYLGYLVAQLPASYLFARFSTGKIIGVCTILWGITVLAFSWTRNFAGAAALRFLLGIFEAPITPGLTLAVGYWWTRDEAPLRMNVIYSALGWAGIIGSLMSAGVSGDSDTGPVKRWQLVFVVVRSTVMFLARQSMTCVVGLHNHCVGVCDVLLPAGHACPCKVLHARRTAAGNEESRK